MADTKEAKPTLAPKPVRWKLAKGLKVDVVISGGTLGVTNENLNKPAMITALTRIEAERGIKLFGVVFIKE